MTRDDDQFGGASRRTFMKVAAATGLLSGVGAATQDQEEVTTYEFDGAAPAWFGTSPSWIEGEQNPPLVLEAGTTYTVRWTNADGQRHNFVIINSDGVEVVRSEVISEQGATQEVQFEATEDMMDYFCEIHPDTMRGKILIKGRDEIPELDNQVVPLGDEIGLQRIAEGFNAPTAFEVAPGVEDRYFLLTQTGQIYVGSDDGLQEEPFLDISDQIVELGIEELHGYDERGLLGIAFHPDFQNNRKFYLRYSAPLRDSPEQTPSGDDDQSGKSSQDPGYDHTDVLAEFTASEDLSSADPDSERSILEIASPQDNHNGGAIEFGSDGYLYHSIGDGGDADDTGAGHVDDWYDVNEGGNGQDTTENLLGSILRIDVDNEADGNAYAIPDDNPFVGSDDGMDEHYAWGFRNPWRMSFDSQNRLFVADAGQNLYEEVNLVENGGNYGWNVREGTHCFSTENPPESLDECPTHTPDDVRGGEPLLDPIIEYPHRQQTTAFIDGSVVIGGYVYEGDAIPWLQDKYVFGNWSGDGVVNPDGEIFVAEEPPDSVETQTETETATPTETPTATPTETETETPTPSPTPSPTPTETETPTPSPSPSPDDTPETETETETETPDTETPGDDTPEGESLFGNEGSLGTSHSSDDLWPIEEFIISGTQDGLLGRYVYAFGRDHDGELYVLTNTDYTPFEEKGELFKLVPVEDGEQIGQADEGGHAETETGTATETQTGTPTETETETMEY